MHIVSNLLFMMEELMMRLKRAIIFRKLTKERCYEMTAEELKAELKRLRDNLCDLEDMHSFTFAKTAVHIGAEKAQNMQAEFEEECRRYNEQIAEIEKELKARETI